MRRTLTWLLVAPFAAVSVLVGHWAAYRVTGAPSDTLHGYLTHAPQVVAILVILALVGLAFDVRARRTSPLPVAFLATAAFAIQEHLERLVHTGHVPALVASPAFLVGIALQLPLAAAVWLAARSVAAHLAPARRTAPPRPFFIRPVRTPALVLVPLRIGACGTSERGPPHSS